MNHTMTAHMNLPAPVGSLEQYIHSVNSIPMLSDEEEIRLGTRLQEENDLEAARLLVLSHLRVVVSVARTYTGYGLNQADLIQEGNIGLMKAVKRFDVTRGVRLYSFAIHWIKAEMNEFVIKNWRLVKVATTKAQRKLFFNLRSMRQSTQTLSPSEAKRIAYELGVKPEEVQEMELRMGGGDIPLLRQDDDSDEVNYAPVDWLADETHEPSQRLETMRIEYAKSEGVSQAIDALDTRSQRIINARWLQDAPATLHDMAAEFGVSAERIRQIEQKAMQKLKITLAPQLA